MVRNLIFFFQLDADLAPLKDVFQNYSGNSQDPDTKAVNALQREVFVQKYLGFLYLAKSDWYTFFCYSCDVVVLRTTQTGWKHPGLIIVGNTKFLWAAATKTFPPAMGL